VALGKNAKLLLQYNATLVIMQSDLCIVMKSGVWVLILFLRNNAEKRVIMQSFTK